jgi:hypothetical protein
MSIEPIGLLTIVIGIICLQLGYRATFAAFIVAALFGSAAALLIGSANIQPAHLLLAFAAIAVLKRPRERAGAIDAIHMPRPGFWLMCLVLYGVTCGIILPRLLAGSSQIIPLGTSEYADTGSTVPLGPVTSNFTQAVYMTGDLVCFMMTVAIASTRVGVVAVTGGLLAYAATSIVFAILDVATYSTGTQSLLEFMRNALYTLHIEEEVSGLKRIVGSFPEASAFARSTLGALGFTGTLWLCGYRPALTGALALASLALVVLSTSSTGLAGMPVVLLILYSTALMRGGFDPAKRPVGSAAVLCAPLLVAALVLTVLIDDKASEVVRDYLDILIFNKAGTDSGIQRASWNSYALQNFLDSYGLGVGLGTVRTSSLPFALLSNVGVPGTLFYLLFITTTFFARRGTPRTFPSDVRLAARNACIGLMIGDCLASPTVDQGLLFYILAGLASAEPERETASLSPGAHRPAGAKA